MIMKIHASVSNIKILQHVRANIMMDRIYIYIYIYRAEEDYIFKKIATFSSINIFNLGLIQDSKRAELRVIN